MPALPMVLEDCVKVNLNPHPLKARVQHPARGDKEVKSEIWTQRGIEDGKTGGVTLRSSGQEAAPTGQI